MLTAGAALCAAIGFAAGYFTAEREPFYYIGTPVELSANNTAPSLNHAHSSQQTEPSLQPEQPVIGPAAAEGICGARTKSGKPCQRKVKGGGYCWQHREKGGKKISRPDTMRSQMFSSDARGAPLRLPRLS